MKKWNLWGWFFKTFFCSTTPAKYQQGTSHGCVVSQTEGFLGKWRVQLCLWAWGPVGAMGDFGEFLFFSCPATEKWRSLYEESLMGQSSIVGGCWGSHDVMRWGSSSGTGSQPWCTYHSPKQQFQVLRLLELLSPYKAFPLCHLSQVFIIATASWLTQRGCSKWLACRQEEVEVLPHALRCQSRGRLTP